MNDKIVINDIELTQDEFNQYKEGGTITDIIEARKNKELTEQERKERKLKQNIKTLRDQIDGNGLDIRIAFDDRNRSWYYRNGNTEIYIEITYIEFDGDENLDYIELYINQDNNIYVTETFNDNDSLVAFLNECVDYVRKLEDAKDACPF